MALEDVHVSFARYAAVFHLSIGPPKSTPGCVGGPVYYPAKGRVNMLNNSRDEDKGAVASVPLPYLNLRVSVGPLNEEDASIAMVFG